MGGIPEFCRLAARLAFGDSSAVLAGGRNATIQCLSGTGSLRVGGGSLSLPSRPSRRACAAKCFIGCCGLQIHAALGACAHACRLGAFVGVVGVWPSSAHPPLFRGRWAASFCLASTRGPSWC